MFFVNESIVIASQTIAAWLRHAAALTNEQLDQLLAGDVGVADIAAIEKAMSANFKEESERCAEGRFTGPSAKWVLGVNGLEAALSHTTCSGRLHISISCRRGRKAVKAESHLVVEAYAGPDNEVSADPARAMKLCWQCEESLDFEDGVEMEVVRELVETRPDRIWNLVAFDLIAFRGRATQKIRCGDLEVPDWLKPVWMSLVADVCATRPWLLERFDYLSCDSVFMADVATKAHGEAL